MKIFPAMMLSSGCGALDLRERKRADGGSVRESKEGEESFGFAREKWCLGGGFEIFQGHICLFRCIG